MREFRKVAGQLKSKKKTFRYDDSPFGSKRKDTDLGWGSNGKSTQWDMDRFDNKHSTSVIEEIPSRKPDEDKVGTALNIVFSFTPVQV